MINRETRSIQVEPFRRPIQHGSSSRDAVGPGEPEKAVRLVPDQGSDVVSGGPILDMGITAPPHVTIRATEHSNVASIEQKPNYRAIVTKELSDGRDPEAYWRQLSARIDAVLEGHVSYFGSNIASLPDTVDHLSARLRSEMNALIPYLAEARLRNRLAKDVAPFYNPEDFRRDLIRQVEEAELVSRMSGGDENFLRRSMDHARILREEVSAFERMQMSPKEWHELRAKAVGRGSGSVLSEVAVNPNSASALNAKIAQLRQGLSQLGIIDRFGSAGREMRSQIRALESRLAHERRMGRDTEDSGS